MPLRPRQHDENIRVITESEAGTGWSFAVQFPADAGTSSETTLGLSWVDYEYWSHGQISPSVVAEAVVRAVIEAQPERQLPPRFDASTARRWVRDLDARIKDLL